MCRQPPHEASLVLTGSRLRGLHDTPVNVAVWMVPLDHDNWIFYGTTRDRH
jgi:hypothetical protein